MKNGLRNLCYAVWTVLGLVLIAHFAGRQADAQGQGTSIVGYASTGWDQYVLTSTGDVYHRNLGPGANEPAQLLGNFWGSGPTAVTPQTWSQIKGQYAPKTGNGN